MKKIATMPSIDLKPVNIHLSDLRYIESVLKDELHSDQVTYEIGDYEYDSLSEIPNTQLPVSRLVIKSKDPYVSIRFARMYSNISSSVSSLAVTGALAQIEKSLKRRVRKLHYYIIRPFAFLGLPVMFALAAISIQDGMPLMVKQFLLTAGVLSILFWVFAIKVTFTEHSIIHLDERKGNFFSRNRDALIVNLIVAVFAAFLTLGVSSIFAPSN